MNSSGRPKPPVKTIRPLSHAQVRRGRFEETGERADPIASEELAEVDASECLLKALSASSNQEKRLFCRLGLSAADVDDELQGLLLRQLYLAELDEENDQEALTIAEEMVSLETLGDIARQDAARAALALGRVDVAIGHLRIAARICPAGRRAFHYGHLGALLRFSGRREDAVVALDRAKRWATNDRALYHAVHALAEADSGPCQVDWSALLERLSRARSQKAYGLWVLGELALRAGERQAAREYLQRFLGRLDRVPRAKALSLHGEIAHAKALLDRTYG